MVGRITVPSAASRSLALARLALAPVAAFVAVRAKAVLRRREVARIADYDDRMLADIGLTREDVARALERPWSEDPTRTLAERRRGMRTG